MLPTMFSPQDHHHMLPYPLPADRGNRWKPGVEVAPNCPRCDSSNTKFCYYNNYSLTQPRYFCKGCRRYWTKGGSLRNVPVGGGCRKNRRSKPVATAGRQSHSHSLPNSLRPDLALDHMVGNSHSSIGESSSTASPTSDGPTIDLALLYTKFLNQCPELDEIVGTSNCHDQVPVQLPAQEKEDGIMGSLLVRDGNQGGDLGFSTDPSGYESLAFTDGGVSDVFLTNCSMVPNLTWQGAEYQGFQPIPENSMFHHHHHHHQDVLIGDWSTLNQSNFDPILM